MSRSDAVSAITSAPWVCERCGCDENRCCRIEIVITRPNGERATILEDECAWSAHGLCTGCDERLIPELRSLIGVWHQLGAIATIFRSS
jgi:hypothetical protein